MGKQPGILYGLAKKHELFIKMCYYFVWIQQKIEKFLQSFIRLFSSESYLFLCFLTCFTLFLFIYLQIIGYNNLNFFLHFLCINWVTNVQILWHTSLIWWVNIRIIFINRLRHLYLLPSISLSLLRFAWDGICLHSRWVYSGLILLSSLSYITLKF